MWLLGATLAGCGAGYGIGIGVVFEAEMHDTPVTFDVTASSRVERRDARDVVFGLDLAFLDDAPREPLTVEVSGPDGDDTLVPDPEKPSLHVPIDADLYPCDGGCEQTFVVSVVPDLREPRRVRMDFSLNTLSKDREYQGYDDLGLTVTSVDGAAEPIY